MSKKQKRCFTKSFFSFRAHDWIVPMGYDFENPAGYDDGIPAQFTTRSDDVVMADHCQCRSRTKWSKKKKIKKNIALDVPPQVDEHRIR